MSNTGKTRGGVVYFFVYMKTADNGGLSRRSEKGVIMHNNPEKHETNGLEQSLVYGKNPVAELLKSGAGVDTVLLSEGLPEAVASYYAALAKQAGAVVKRVHPNKLRASCGTDSHQGVAAYASSIAYAGLDELLDAAREKGEPPFLVLADGVEDPHNLGAIIRSALLCGAHGVVIPKRGGAAVTPTVLKSSAGAAARRPVARVANIGESVRRRKEQGVVVYCAEMDGQPLEKADLTGAVALVMGSEGRGVSPLVRKLCDGAVSLAMAGRGTGVDSFNVSVAAGIILYEIARQRR